jgi:hypothetical protein
MAGGPAALPGPTYWRCGVEWLISTPVQAAEEGRIAPSSPLPLPASLSLFLLLLHRVATHSSLQAAAEEEEEQEGFGCLCTF